jgi:choline-sulfatase
VRDHTIFSYDDLFFLPASVAGRHIRAVREGDWTCAVYFGLDGSGLEYELYDIKGDPGQLHNLLYGRLTHDILREWARLNSLVTDQPVAGADLHFGWPVEPALT